MKPKVSIIVPTREGIEDIKRMLNSIRRLNLQDKVEVLIIDSNSSASTIQTIKSFGFPTFVQTGNTSKGEARNIGIQKAKADIIVNTDSDVKILEGWYEALLQSMEYCDIVAGYAPDPKDRQLPRVPIFVDGQDITYPCCNIAHKRKVFNDVGLYDVTQNLPEDIEFNYRCVKKGYVLHYNPKMKLYHHQRSTKKGFLKQAFWNGEARYELDNIHPEFKHSHQHGVSAKSMMRLGIGFFGYTLGRYLKSKGENIWKEDDKTGEKDD